MSGPVDDDLATVIAAVAAELPPGHLAAWCAVLRRVRRPTSGIEGALLEARTGYALGGVAGRLVSAWRRTGVTGETLALALQAAGIVCRERSDEAARVAVSGPVSDAVPVRLTGQVALAVIREATGTLLVVSFAAHGVTEIITELAATAARGVRIDLVLESSVDDGGTLAGTGAAAAFDVLRTHAGVTFWHWPQRHRAAHGGSRAALHAKLIAADDRCALLGSANLTDRALHWNLEIGVLLRERAAVRSIVDHFRSLMRPAEGPLEPVASAEDRDRARRRG